MPLVIGLEAGEDVFIGSGPAEIKVTVTDIFGPNRFKVLVEKSTINHRYEIKDDYAVDLGPGISLGCGKGGTVYKARVLIQAPRQVQIERGKWRRNQEKKGGS